ncbi:MULTISPECIES: DUF61 family protein [Methanobacterium]|jgi:uncharacterized protein (UPF0216 family)|uniref:UPF0216 protein O3H35_04260 n=1 Tax=Methanobacterium veterum TaxID=408577 RepID=A0A9E5DLF9_9EURY|nr:MULTISPECIES: DUF61 family protein [Methanobacterium]MCZ3366327.1 DUF61 family protein [Methanobacterium veterum]MCZ3371835.1 DUF61 family protein [Methanobacterium veterum]
MKKLDPSDNILKKQVISLNRHLPRRRKTLAELLKEERPHVLGADGTRHRFKNAELKEIASMIDKEDYKKLKLPIYIEIESLTSGARIAGDMESTIICKILNIDPCKRELFIYRPQIKELRIKFPTTTQYIFLVR